MSAPACLVLMSVWVAHAVATGPPSSDPLDCDCDAVPEMAPPPELEALFPLPPPPLPVFLQPLQHVADDDGCDLCEWAGAGPEVDDDNATTTTTSDPGSDVGTPREEEEVEESLQGDDDDDVTGRGSGGGISREAAWISILVVASITSAALGAALMVFVLKCRKIKILPVSDSCPVLGSGGYFGSKSGAGARCRNCAAAAAAAAAASDAGVGGDSSPKAAVAASVVAASKPRLTGGGWSFWRRGGGTSGGGGATDRSPASAMCSEENSYSEEPYVVSEHSSALYAELNSVCQEGQAPFRTYSMNTYSEVVDPNGKCCHHHHHHHRRHLISDGTYENAAYVVSDDGDAPCPVETDSVDTPSSSAYYSDSSNQKKLAPVQQRRLTEEQEAEMEEDRERKRDEEVVTPAEPDDDDGLASAASDDYGGGTVPARYGHDRSSTTCCSTTTGVGQFLQTSSARPLPPIPSHYV